MDTRTIYAVHMVGGTKHEHIAEVKWTDNAGRKDKSSTAAMVAWLKESGNKAQVADDLGFVRVGVVEVTPPHIRTYKDSEWKDNLLHIDRY